MDRIIDKPWGREELLEVNDHYVVKALFINAGHRLSLQFHEVKQETIFVHEGKINLYLDHTSFPAKTLSEKQYYTIPPKAVHRFEAIEDSIIIECSTPELTDVVRLEDDYDRS